MDEGGGAWSRDAVDRSAFLEGMRRLSAAVCILATEQGGERFGLTATAVCSLSADPPQLLACVNRTARAEAPIRESGRFTVNVLGAHQRDLAHRFAAVPSQAERFAAGVWRPLHTGAPILDSAVVAFDCSVAEAWNGSTHTVFVGLVHAVVVTAVPPLLYADGAYAALGPLAESLGGR